MAKRPAITAATTLRPVSRTRPDKGELLRLRPRSTQELERRAFPTWRDRWNAVLDLLAPVKGRSVAVFLDQFGSMIENGLAPATALDSLAQHQDDPRLASVLQDISLRVHSGSSISKALARHPRLFPPAALLVIRAGEVGGDIGGRLRRAAQLLSRQCHLRARLAHAATSPLLTAAVCGLVVFLVISLVFPKFIALYDQMGLQLPLISQFVFTVVGIATHPLTWLTLGAGGLYVFAFRHQLGQRLFNLLLRIPSTRGMVGNLLCASLCETLAYLYKDGVPVHRALYMLESTTPFELHRARLKRAGQVLGFTGSLSEAMDVVEYFPPGFHSMLVVGEESGTMEEMLTANRRLLEEEIDGSIACITSTLEPLMLCGLGIGMGVLFVGMFLPIYGVLSTLA